MLGNGLLILSILVTDALGHSGSKHGCGTSSKRFRRDDLEVLGHLINHNSLYHKVGRSAYFSGSEIVKLRTATLSNHKFTVELWIKPEGGQLSGVPILNFYDRCLVHTDTQLWHLGLKEIQKGRDMRFYFALNTHRIKEPHEIIAHESIRPDTWVHIAVVFNGSSVKLYINQAQVGVSHKELSPVSSVPVKKCEVLELGGDSRVSRFFRGTVDDLRLWNVAKSQRAIVRDMFKTDFNLNNEELALYEKFEDVLNHGKFETSYKPVTVSLPELVVSTVPKDLHQIEARKPLCGVTVCDNPDVVRGYKENIYLRRERLLRYRLIYFADDDGKNPLVTTKQIKKQHKKLNSAFSKHNITWHLSIHEIRNTSLKEKTILVTCNPSKIGDGICQDDPDHCNVKATGYDAGDCGRHERNNCKDGFNCPKCDRSMLKNGKCNPECNNSYYKWDGGDCCNKAFGKTSKTCLDPKSPNRAYITIKELKEVVGLDNHKYLNVYLGKMSSKLDGKATFPWDKFAHGIQGGTVLKADRFGKNEGMNDMVHELGHNLGLWHVHKGISESRCDDPCFETHASMELGDLCADTNPTPINHKCHEPSGGICGIKRFKKAPYRNYMGYGGARCHDHFTKDQVSRMHCYIDYLCQGWSLGNEPSTIPIKPKILSYAMGTVQFEWLPPLSIGNGYVVKNCNRCDIHGTKLRQFAATAYSPIMPKHQESQVPRQAVGPPDANRCFVDSLVWLPDLGSTVETGFIDLGFEKEVIPSGIKIWVTYNVDHGTIDIELLHVDKSITSLGSAYAQCDMPYTRRIVTNKATKRVRIRPSGKDIGIDAVQLISEENSQHCKGCPRIEYIVSREPPFQSGEPVRVKTTRFEDKEVKEDAYYEYHVQTAIGNQMSPPSLLLKFSAKSGFCGDGIIERRNGEECDDANSRDGDGCSIQCKKEDVFRCKGQPSICYKYEGDGICEEFEKRISIVDCGFYVPDGFQQQWAVSANGNEKHKSKSYDVIIGPPPRDLKCIHSDPSEKISWCPCHQFSDDGDYWIIATFAKPVVASAVVIYIASDGRSEWKAAGKHQNARIELIDTKKKWHKIGAANIRIDCKRHPITIPVLHDMTKPYFKTKAVRIRFSFYGIAISAVALQSSTKLDPFVASSCDVSTKEYYNPATQSCNPYNMKVPSCKPLVMKKMVVSCTGTKDGDSCKVACTKGYRPNKSVTVKCIMGKWSKVDLKCVPADCGKIKIKRAQLDCREGTTYKSTCTFNCIGKSHLVGVDNQITCLADGLWTARKASCQMYCPAPPQIDNSDPLDSSCEANHMKARRKNDMGTVCSFHCRPGFTLMALSKNYVGTHAQLTCKEDGKWFADSKCVQIKCPELLLFASLAYNCSNKNNYGSICTTFCSKDETTHKVICEANGKWSSDFNYCNYKGRCEDLLPTKEIVFESCKNNVKGSCLPRCKKKGYDIVIRGQEELLKIKLLCLPDLTWFPHQSTIYCFPTCKEKPKGNGVCDCHNNNKHCNYDDGDCCSATITGGGSVYFINGKAGESRDCKCIDPRAREVIKKPVTAKPIDSGPKVSPLTGSGDDAQMNIYNDDEGGDDNIEVVQT